jgi:putative MATE family efflux protein
MRMRIDMTGGSPLKRMLAFCAPMLLGSLIMQCANLLDSLIVSRAAGVGAFAAIAAAAPVAFLGTGFLMGFCNGFLIPIALAVGAGDRDGADRLSSAALLMTAFMAVAVAVPASLLSPMLIRLAGTPSDIAPGALSYLRIALSGLPVPLISMTLWGILRADGDTRTPFLFQMLGTALHLALDLIFIAGLRMGVSGAAFASLLAHSIACALLLRRVLRARPGLLKLLKFGVRPEIARRLFTLGVPIALTNLMTSAGSTAFQFAINSLGSTAVAAVAAGDRLLSLPLMPAMMLGGVIEVFSGQNLGARKPERIKTGVFQLFFLIVGFLVPVTLLMTAGSGLFVPLLTGDMALAAPAREYMLWCALFIPFLCVNNLLKNVLQGVGLPEKAVLASVFDLFVRLACALIGVGRFGYAAILLTNPVGWTLSAAALIVSCRAVYPRVMRRGSNPAQPGVATRFTVQKVKI